MLLTTQYMEEADRLADRIVVIDGGRVIADDTPAALKVGLGNTVTELGFGDAVQTARAHDVIASVRGVRAEREGTAEAGGAAGRHAEEMSSSDSGHGAPPT